MPKLDFQTLDRELRAGTLRPVYLLIGGEAHLASLALTRLEETIGCTSQDPSRLMLTGREATAEIVHNALMTIPLLGGRPVVIIRDGEHLSKGMMDTLARYLERPVDTATLIMLASKLDGRTRLATLAQEKGAVVECKPLYANQVPTWVAVEVRRRGKQISQEAARFFVDVVGTDLGGCATEIEKLFLFVGPRATIELQDVETVCAATHQRTVFELTDAIGEQNVKRAMLLLGNILDQGESPIMLLTMIARHMRLLLKAKELQSHGAGDADAARVLGVHPFFAKNYLGQAKRFSKENLRKSFRSLSTTDRELKSIRIPAERIMERLVFTLCRTD